MQEKQTSNVTKEKTLNDTIRHMVYSMYKYNVCIYIYTYINATSYPPRNPKFDILCLDEYCRNPCSRRVLHGLDTSRSSSSVLSRAAPLSRVILHNWQASFECTDAFVDDFDCKVTPLPGTLHSFKEPLYPLKVWTPTAIVQHPLKRTS